MIAQLVLYMYGSQLTIVNQHITFVYLLKSGRTGSMKRTKLKTNRKGLTGLVRVRLDSDREKIISIEAERHSKEELEEEYENISD